MTERRIGYHADRNQQGLYLQVGDGVEGITRSWIVRYFSPITRKRREMGIGSVSDVPLSQARQKALEARALLAQGKEPNHRAQLRPDRSAAPGGTVA
jgi:hypothetical protein